MHEFSFIDDVMRPLSGGRAEALGLRDDAALLSIPDGMELVITKDVVCEGVHFIGDEPAHLIAQKALRVNLSDIAAMGAVPYGYFLGLALPARCDEAWLRDLALGLQRDGEAYGVAVLGGDTTRTQAHLVVSVTMLGLVARGAAKRRDGARAGDVLAVTGTLGDAVVGLDVVRGRGYDSLNASQRAFVVSRYQLPQPRTALVPHLGAVHAMMDLSDGLLQDAGHMARASGVDLIIEKELLPLSEALQELLHHDGGTLWTEVFAGGDDYELLMSLPAGAAVPEGGTVIGRVEAGEGRVRLMERGQEVTVAHHGYRHF